MSDHIYKDMESELKAIVERDVALRNNPETTDEEWLQLAIDQIDLYQVVDTRLRILKQDTPWEWDEHLENAQEIAVKGIEKWSRFASEIRQKLHKRSA